jgi:DNA-binding GntR family transcriptional regulator
MYYSFLMSKGTIRKSLTSGAYDRLRRDVLSWKLRPGERLNINELCQTTGFNLSAVREAISKLTADGLVIADERRGFSVAPISVSELRDLTRVRAEIENLCLRRAMTLGDLSWEAGVMAAYHIMSNTKRMLGGEAAVANEAWWTAHGSYHRALVSACDSPWLMRLRDQLFDQSERYRILGTQVRMSNTRDVEREHQEITEAVLARDADRATGLMAAHFEMTTHILLQADEAGARLSNGESRMLVDDAAAQN